MQYCLKALRFCLILLLEQEEAQTLFNKIKEDKKGWFLNSHEHLETLLIENENISRATLIIAKHRNGPTTDLDFIFKTNTSTFNSVDESVEGES